MTKILIVDDSRTNLFILQSILKGDGFDVITAMNGVEALDAVKAGLPDLVISDILMPVMDGFELCRRWMSDGELKRIPFIFYSSTYTDSRDERFALDLGAGKFLTKPQKPEIIVAEVRNLLEKSREGEAGPSPTGLTGDETRLLRQYNEVLLRKLEQKVHQLETEIAEHRKAKEEIALANRKLALLSEVTCQDIQNKITGLRGYVELSSTATGEGERAALIGKQLEILESIRNLIEKTKDYQQLGTDQSRWIHVEQTIRMQLSIMSLKEPLPLHCNLNGIEIYTDPRVDRVFYNLIHNTVRHGSRHTRLSFACRESPDGAVIVCEDDGVGIPHEEKARIFDRIVVGDAKFVLFFVREFLQVFGMGIAETGEYGRGARFEIAIPKDAYRFGPEA